MTNGQYIEKTAYRLKALEREVEAFRSGDKYVKMEEARIKQTRSYERTINSLRRKLETADKKVKAAEKKSSKIAGELEKAHQKQLEKKDRKIEQLKALVFEAQRQRDIAKDDLRDTRRELKAVRRSLEEAEGKISKLTAQVNKNFENSSIPSSQQGPGRKKIPCSRVKTDRKRGAQPGHSAQARKKHQPTETVVLPAPEQVLKDPDNYSTGREKRKQLVELVVKLKVTEYIATEYRNRKTGSRAYAAFPEGVVDDVNYDGSIKAFLCLLNTECNVSIAKAARFIKEISGGQLEISSGMIAKLNAELSGKTADERKAMIEQLMASPVMHADFTNANLNGDSWQVLVVSDPDDQCSLYIPREKKGHAGIKGTVLEAYGGTLVHDHDKTFYSYGTRHQECMQHNLRYLKGSMDNEKQLTWNTSMHELIREMLHYKNGLNGSSPDAGEASKFEAEYDEILAAAEKEYLANPPTRYYRDGYNLYKRLKEYRESQLLFLHEANVPSNNSVCERLARVYKRKQKQMTVARSEQSLEALCNALSIIHSYRAGKAENVAEEIAAVFNRPDASKNQGNRFKQKDSKDSTG